MIFYICGFRIMVMRVIGITGLARSGKDTVADYIESEYGFKKFVMSDVLRDVLVSRSEEVSKKSMLELGNELRETNGQDVVARMVYERCRGFEKVTVVGFRSPAEVRFFEKVSARFSLVEVTAHVGFRVRRAEALGVEDVSSRDHDDVVNKGLDAVFSMASVVVDNNSTLDVLYPRVDEMMAEIGYAGD